MSCMTPRGSASALAAAAAPGAATDAARPFVPRRLDRRAVAAAELFLRLAPSEIDLEGSTLSLRFTPSVASPAGMRRIDLSVGDRRVSLLVDARGLRAVIGAAGAGPEIVETAPALALAVLETLLAPWSQALEARLGCDLRLLRLGDAAGGEDAPAVLGLRARYGGSAFAAAICAGDVETFEWLARHAASIGSPRRPAAWGALPIAACLRIGTARLSPGELAMLVPGCGILLGDTLMAAGRALLVFGERLVAPCTLARGGALVEAAPCRAAQWQEWIMDDDLSGDVMAATAAAPEGELRVTVVFELGRRLLDLDSIRTLTPGQVLHFGPADASAPVTILCNGARIGRGEIVQVGEALAVRVLELARRD